MSNPVHMARGKKGIVGAAFRKTLKSDQEIPVSLEQVLLRAAGDRDFRDALLEDREAALEESDLTLRPSEIAILQSMSDQVLSATIARLDPPRQRNQLFAKAVATAVAGTVMFTVSCDSVDGGADPNWDASEDTGAETDADADADADGE